MQKKLVLLLFFLLLGENLKAIKLDINLENYFNLKSLNSLRDRDKSYNISYFVQNSYLYFTLKNIPLEKYDADMDISIGLRFLNINYSSKTLNTLYINEMYKYYDSKNIFFYPDKAYVKFYNFPYNDTLLNIGKFPFKIASGIALDDNQMGFNGIQIEIQEKLYTDKINLFYFQTESDINTYQTTHHIYGININKSFGDGNWEVYYIKDNANGYGENIGYTFKNTNKNFYGTSYLIDNEKISYMIDLVFEGGNSQKISNQIIEHKAYAYNINAGWKMKIPIFGKTKTRVGFLKSSGNSSKNFTKDKSFFSSFSKRYTGFERFGYGEIFKASIYDTSKTTNTITGFNENLSGLTISNLGFDINYKKGKLVLDYFNYSATKTQIQTLSTFIGSEYNVKYIFEMSKNVNLSLTYGSLKLKEQDKPTKLLSISLYSSF